MKKTISILFLFIFTSLIFPHIIISAPIDKSKIPPDLIEWIPWVLYGQDEKLCPTFCNNSKAYQCIWPSFLYINAEKNKGHFQQEWTVFAKGWIPLPGSIELWPEKVLANGAPSIVIRVDDTPCLLLEPGKYLVSGEFYWKEIPEIMQIPDKTGLISLKLNNRDIHFPVIDNKGHLWLQKRLSPKTQEDKLEVNIYRKIIDDIPMKIVNLIQLNISGKAREIRLNNILLDKAVALKLTAPVPVRIGENGEILTQAGPGKWNIEIITRFKQPVNKIGPVKGAYGQETWAFQSKNDLRMVEIQGVTSIDPSRTGLPDAWKSLPAYLVDKDIVLNFKQILRGNSDPAPDRISIRRTWWLDFDSKGFTIQDHIKGTMSRNWYLAMNPSSTPGRVSVNGTDQLITKHGGKNGIEIRQGSIEVTAESRLNSAELSTKLPATGWDHDFEKASGTLNLPPGWKLFAVNGVDSASGTWFRKWTLLDIFIILIISIGTMKLRSKIWGIAALITMILIWHEKNAPCYIWLHILAAFTLLKILPLGKMKNFIRLWAVASVIILLVITIPFMIHQIRCGIYPQLEYPWKTYNPSQVQTSQYQAKRMDNLYQSTAQEAQVMKAPSISYNYYKRKKAVFTHDPNANVQTGPGLPSWSWRSVDIKWHGPVNKSQTIRFWLISPEINLILGFVRVILLGIFILGLLNVMKWRNSQNWPGLSLGFLFFIIVFSSAKVYAGEFPPTDLLKELEVKLLEKDDCYKPACASFSRMDVYADANNIDIKLEVHAAKQIAVPLPGNVKAWQPKIILLDEQKLNTILKDNTGNIWVLVPEGIHILTLKGLTGTSNEIHLPMILKPFYAVINVEAWDVKGIHSDGRVENSIQLTRLKKKQDIKKDQTTDILPPFLQIERTISIGIKWEVTTKITRQSPLGTPVILYIPLLSGESVTTRGIHVKDSQALVNMKPQQKEITWISSLEKTKELILQASDTAIWAETWIIDASPIWHLEFAGIPVIHNQDSQGLWKPTWRPWPGEKVSIKISKPEAVEGQTVTIDNAQLTWTPGNRISNAHLQMKIRASKGTRHQLTLPDNAQLKQVKINNQTRPIRQKANIVSIPLSPGTQNIDIEWQQNKAMSFFEKGQKLDIGAKAVNARIKFNMPKDRWILMTKGPQMGPAVLFWSYLFIIMIAAICLGRVQITPLKTYHWILLGLGLTQIDSFGAIIVVGWFIALGFRKIKPVRTGWFYFNFIQLSLVVWTIAAMFCFYLAIKKGLLGIPEMQIAGNGSSSAYLYWTQDRINGIMPQPWVLSLPRLTYHFFMLLWALWLATALVKWFNWAWECFSHIKLWEKASLKKTKKLV